MANLLSSTTNAGIVVEKPAATAHTPLLPATAMTDGPKDPYDAFVMGYPRITTQMSFLPETAAFRRFGALNARNLLYLQADLAHIEVKLLKLEKTDNESTEGKKHRYAVDAYWLNSARTERDDDSKQKDLVLKMRETLNLYNNALIQQRAILLMNSPDPYDLDVMQHFLGSECMAHGVLLLGPDSEIWGTLLRTNSHSGELVVLKERNTPDLFLRKLSEWAVPLVEIFAPAWFKKPDPQVGVVCVRDAHIFNITMGITGAVAAAMPVVAMAVLLRMETLAATLGACAALNALLAVCLVVFTEARRTDVFYIIAL